MNYVREQMRGSVMWHKLRLCLDKVIWGHSFMEGSLEGSKESEMMMNDVVKQLVSEC